MNAAPIAGQNPSALDTAAAAARLVELTDRNREIHEHDCLNLNPATNTMNPAAEALLAAGLGNRPSLGHPGDKYEMGLEAIEQIELLCADAARQVFRADHAEIRIGSGALANLYTFMAAAQPGDAVIVPPATIGGHVTHNRAGAAGLYGLDIHEAPIDPERYSVDVAALAEMAERVRPKVISIGGSLNLCHHPVRELREVADSVGAVLLFDAAHLSGPIAGGAWPDPLAEGAHVMTMSTYKSLAGPPAGLLVTNDADLAERVDAIAFPGLTANFDVANSAALAMTLLDWIEHGEAHATAMVETASALAAAMIDQQIPVHVAADGPTVSHAFAVDCSESTRLGGGGHGEAKWLRLSNLLTCAIGLPHDPAAGLRIGTNELVRWGMGVDDMDTVARLFAEAWYASEPMLVKLAAQKVTEFRSQFDQLHFIR